MWTAQSEQLANGRVIRITVELGSSPIAYADVLHRWQNDAEFRLFFIGLLARPSARFDGKLPQLLPQLRTALSNLFCWIVLVWPGTRTLTLSLNTSAVQPMELSSSPISARTQ
jgi:hypothetical protein